MVLDLLRLPCHWINLRWKIGLVKTIFFFFFELCVRTDWSEVCSWWFGSSVSEGFVLVSQMPWLPKRLLFPVSSAQGYSTRLVFMSQASD